MEGDTSVTNLYQNDDEDMDIPESKDKNNR